MCFWVLPITGIPLARTTIQAILNQELQNEEVKRALSVYDTAIHEKLLLLDDSSPAFRLLREDEPPEDEIEQEPVDFNATAPIIDEIEADAYDELLHVKPVLHRDGQMIRSRNIGRKRD
jgi:hypothetical protein